MWGWTIWAATTSGLWRFDHSRWQHVGSEANVPPGTVAEVGFDQEGTLWALSGQPPRPMKLLQLRRGSIQFQTVGDELQFQGFTLDAERNVITGPESETPHSNSSGDSLDLHRHYPVFRTDSDSIVNRANGVWISSSEPVVLRAEAGGQLSDVLREASAKNSETYNLNPYVFAKLVDPEGNIWFGDPKGIHRFFYSPLLKQELPESRILGCVLYRHSW
jgi:ligand-binding sensor domain-containing protein